MTTNTNTEQEWSAELREKMQILSPKQRRAITLIVIAELQGLSPHRMLRQANSCPWCGRVYSGERRLRHEAVCQRRGQPWQFAADRRSYYRFWQQSAEFRECLALARQEASMRALAEATRTLQMAAPVAASELRRQVEAGQKDSDRRQAAVAILDRADIKTSPKGQVEQLSLWLDDLRAEDEGQEEGKNQ